MKKRIRKPKSQNVLEEVYAGADYEGLGTKWELWRVARGDVYVGIVYGGDWLGKNNYHCFGVYERPQGRAIESLGAEINNGLFSTDSMKGVDEKAVRAKLIRKFYLANK